MNLPETFRRRVVQTWGERGRVWLADLPATAGRAAERWSLSDLRPFSNLTYHFVASAVREGSPVVVKIGVPGAGLDLEAAALSSLEGVGTPRLYAFDPELSALLMERLDPGVPLETVWTPESDPESTRILAEFIPRMPPPPADRFPHVLDWLAAIREVAVPYRSEAVRLIDAVDPAALPVRLLHGDLHHGNVLSHRGAHALIDPKGVLGPPAFEAYALFHNPVGVPESLLADLLPSRLDIVAQTTGLSKAEIARWSFLGLVLSMSWEIQDRATPSPVTETLANALMQRY